MKLTKEEVNRLLGKTFKGTVVCDDLLDPYFIVKYAEGGFGVMKTRTDAKGALRFRALCYPASFMSCLDVIAKNKHNEEGKVYESINEYIERWNEVSRTILEAYKAWNVNPI